MSLSYNRGITSDKKGLSVGTTARNYAYLNPSRHDRAAIGDVIEYYAICAYGRSAGRSLGLCTLVLSSSFSPDRMSLSARMAPGRSLQ